MFEWAKSNIEGIHFFFADKENVFRHRDALSIRFKSVQTVPGTRSHHRFVPIDGNKLKMFRLSSDDTSTTVNISSNEQQAPDVNMNDLHPGQFVCVIYDAEWYIGCIMERSDEHEDIMVRFMSRARENTFFWPQRDDVCWLPFTNVICRLPPPTLSGSSARQYRYEDAQVLNCQTLFARRQAANASG